MTMVYGSSSGRITTPSSIATGPGKSTTMEAIQQCLFNKTTSPTPIEDTSRKAEGTSRHNMKYALELTFETPSDRYRIINDRRVMTIQIFKNDDDMMFKSIPQSLKFIQEVLGMDFNTFVTLTFINHATITELLDNFSSSALMKVVLNFSQIASFERNAKVEQKALNITVHSIQSQLQTIKDSLEALSIYKQIDTAPLMLQKVTLMAKHKTFTMSNSLKLAECKTTMSALVIRQTTLSDTLNKKTKLLDSTTCEMCGQSLQSLEDPEELQEVINTISVELQVINGQVEAQEIIIQDINSEKLSVTNDYTIRLQDVENNIIVARTRNELYNQTYDRVEALKLSSMNLTTELSNIQLELSIIQAALVTLKSGSIQSNLLTTFVVVLNNHLNKFIEFVSLDYVTISAEAFKASVNFKIEDTRFSQTISIHTLSGGEKTRLRLVVLLSMLYTIRDLAQISTNLLFFDESLDTLDKSAQADLSRLFEYMLQSDKFIALVSHGGQLNDINFTGTITASKTKGITSVSKELF